MQTRSISEADWKVFRQLQPIALERFCQRVLDEVATIASDSKLTSHERYLAVYRLMKRRDKELATAFDGPKRSDAWLQLSNIQHHGLLTEEEMSCFSAETRAVLAVYLGRA